jgi:hypothetical protein
MELSTIGIIVSLALGFISIAGIFLNFGIGLRGFISPLWASHEEVPIQQEVMVHKATRVANVKPPIVLMNRAPFHVVVVDLKPGSVDQAMKNANNRVWFQLEEEPQVPFVIPSNEAVKLILTVHIAEDDFVNKSYGGSITFPYKCASFIRKKGELSLKYNFKVKSSITEF